MTVGGENGADARRAAWSAYWAQGTLHSCTGSFDASYSGAIGSYWDGIVDAMPADARVLDLATGNGALPLRLWEARDRLPGLQVDAVDLAALAPAWYKPATHAGITFHSGVAMEELPFADASFDRVFSQFGLEYARLEEAVRECVRVARDGATLAFVMHHADSVLVRVGHAELANQALLLAPGGLLDAARGVLPWIARMRGGDAGVASDPQALLDRQAYNAAMERLSGEIACSDVPDALLEARDRIHRLLAGAGPGNLDSSLSAIDEFADAMRSAALRTREMIEHALDQPRLVEMVAMIESARPGCQVQHAPLAQREGVLAWGLVAKLPGSSTSSNGPSAAS